MSILDIYLEQIQNNESIFPMDSPHVPQRGHLEIKDEDEDDEKTEM